MRNKICIVAEISANHGNDINIVKKSIKKAKEIGCDAAKIQTYRPDTITIECSNEFFRIDTGTIWDGTTLYDLYNDAHMPWEWHSELFAYAAEIDFTLFSTPFDFTAVDLLEECNNPIYKIASFEITDIPLIKYAAKHKKPMIISTGIATKDEIKGAVEACLSVGNEDICILKCTSEYPANIEDANLLTMSDMEKEFPPCRVGLSDHTIGTEVPIVAAAMGAKIIEKHFILDKKIGGPDSSFSMDPDEFSEMIKGVRTVEKIHGVVTYEIDEKKAKDRKYARSLFVVEDVRAGETLTYDNVKSIRPAYGEAPKELENLIGKRFNRDVSKGTPLSNEILNDE